MRAKKQRGVVDQAAAVVLLQDALDAETCHGPATGQACRPAFRGGRRPCLMTGCSPCSTLPARRRSRALALGLTASVLALGAGGHAVLKPHLYPDDFDGGGGEPVTVRIAPGATAADVASTLAGAGVVASVGSFVNVAEQRSMASWLRPGHYRLRRGMAAAAALDLLLAPGSRGRATGDRT